MESEIRHCLPLSLFMQFNYSIKNAWWAMQLQHIHYKHSLSLSYLPAGHPSWRTPPWVAPGCRLTWRKVRPAGRPPRSGSSPPTSPWRAAPSPPAETWSLYPSASTDLTSRDRQEQKRDGEENVLWYLEQTYYPCFLSRVSLTSHLLGFSLQLSLVIFCLTGNPFILILVPVRNKHDVLHLIHYTGLSIYKPSFTTFQNCSNHLSSKNATMHYFLTFYRLNNSKD